MVKSSILRYYQAPFGLIKSQMDSLDFFRYMHKEKSAPPPLPDTDSCKKPFLFVGTVGIFIFGFRAISRLIFSL